MQGLLGRDGIDGAILLCPARSVHSFGMAFTIDVAFCTKDLVVLRTICLRPGRMTRPCLKGGCVIEAESGAFDRWKLQWATVSSERARRAGLPACRSGAEASPEGPRPGERSDR